MGRQIKGERERNRKRDIGEKVKREGSRNREMREES